MDLRQLRDVFLHSQRKADEESRRNKTHGCSEKISLSSHHPVAFNVIIDILKWPATLFLKSRP